MLVQIYQQLAQMCPLLLCLLTFLEYYLTPESMFD